MTLMPTVAHYVCPNSECHSLVTHEIVHVSEDLKHDAHLVKQFTTKAISILEKSKIPIHKIIEFTDEAPAQYKNKTAFRYMTQYKVPIVHNFFGICHGKSSCNACTGRVKQGVSRLVHSEIELVNSAKTFYTACVKHLAKPPKCTPEECQHHIRTFELHPKLPLRPKTTSWPAVLETHKFHSIGNTNTNNIYLRIYTCCCVGCLHGEEECTNEICRDELRGYDFKLKEFIKPNLDFWFRDRQPIQPIYVLHKSVG